MTNRLVQILMDRDDMSYKEANHLLNECGEMVRDGCDPEEILYDELGLEPDYIFDLIEFI